METRTATAAERNRQPLLEALTPHLPSAARILEVAAGDGTHAIHFSTALPQLTWLATDPDPHSLALLTARCAGTGLANLLPPRRLDVLESDWQLDASFDAVVAINLLHISPFETTPALFAGASRVLRPDGAGLVVLYGAYKERGVHTAPSNETFDDWLRQKDPRFGVRDLEVVEAEAVLAGFRRIHMQRMPANNLFLVFRRA